MDQFVLLIWPKSEGGGGKFAPVPFSSLVPPVLLHISIDSTAAAFLLRTTSITLLTIKCRILLISYFVKVISAMKVFFVQFKTIWSPLEFLSFHSLYLKKF